MKTKRVLSYFLLFFVCFSSVFVKAPLPVYAVEETGEGYELILGEEGNLLYGGEVQKASPSDAADFTFNAATGTISKYIGSAKTVVIPESIEGVAVKVIGKRAFVNAKIESLVLNEGLEEIAEGAFGSCAQLKEIYFPSSLRRIGQGAFVKNTALSELKLNEGLLYIGNYAFSQCTALKSVTLPDSLEQLGNFIFQKCPIETELVLGSRLGHVGHSLLAGNTVSTRISIRNTGGGKLYLHDELFVKEQDSLQIPQEREVMVLARAFHADSVLLDCGEIEVSADAGKEEVLRSIREKVLLSAGFAVISGGDMSGDRYVETEPDWDLSAVEIRDNALVEAKFRRIPPEAYVVSFPEKAPKQDVTEAGLDKMRIQLRLRVKQEDTVWESGDFLYAEVRSKLLLANEYFAITGFSEQGEEKLRQNKHLVLPATVKLREGSQEVEKQVQGIGEKAFLGKGLESVRIEVPEGYREYIIDAGAFENNALKEIEIPYGVKFIESYAFRKNGLESLYVPETVVKLGNESFAYNQIQRLQVSDQVEKFQFDGFSFAHNRLREVDLPFSIFKLLENVFFENTGAEGGKVRLYTRNPKHLETSSYINPHSDYHYFVLQGEDVNRENLSNLINGTKNLDEKDYTRSSWAFLQEALVRAKEVMAAHESTQAEVDAAAESLQAAVRALILEGLRTKDLEKAIERLSALKPLLYTADSFARLQQDLQAAKDTLGKTGLQQAEVDGALEKLLDAEKNLVLSEEAKYKPEDFTFAGSSITGFSAGGLEKFAYNKNLVLPDRTPEGEAVTEIADLAFKYTGDDYVLKTDEGYSPNGLSTVQLPSGLRRIGKEAFRYHKIRDLQLPSTLEEIDDLAFNGNSLTGIEIPDSVVKMGIGVFSLNNIQSAKLSKSMTEVPAGIFSRNIRLSEIEIYEGTEKIREAAFVGCPLTKLHLPSTLKEIEARAFMSHRVEELHIPASVEKIGEHAFASNKKFRYLKKVHLEEGIREIGSNAFKSSLIEEIYIPRSLEILDKDAFNDNLNSKKEVIRTKVYTYNPQHLSLFADRKYELILLNEQVPTLPEEKSNASGSSGGSSSFVSVGKNDGSSLQGGTWQKDDKGWWYKQSDGSYPRESWKKSGEAWYFFDSAGYMAKGWVEYQGNWYYLNPEAGAEEGKMCVGWIEYRGKWYYLWKGKDADSGKMLRNTLAEGWRILPDGSWDGLPQLNTQP